jgi:AraC-like DNA-binding protein
VLLMGRIAPDPRLFQAAGAHSQAGDRDLEARRHRDERDRIVRELRAEDPKTWTMSRLAAEIGCSKELIAYILKTTPGEDPCE